MTSVNLEECEKFAEKVAREAGELIVTTCGKITSVETKIGGFADLVTETDRNVEQLVFNRLKREFPHHKFIGEEEYAANNYLKVELTDEPTWIIDPVDG